MMKFFLISGDLDSGGFHSPQKMPGINMHCFVLDALKLPILNYTVVELQFQVIHIANTDFQFIEKM